MAFIELDHVHVRYPLRGQGMTAKDLFINKLLGRKSAAPEMPRHVHAIRGVSFRLEDGERVGIIGYNGAGKTTLLRTMAGIYPPASGTRRIKGSICSLLDIGVGLEGDSNGWDNIRYRGYLQGETPRTLKPKIPEIAAFTELGDFMNLPARCYSQGMALRLAFAIATSSLPEILFVDEVFATGDLAFQTKAEERMRLFMDRARIVVMVGHNLTFLEQFTHRVIWLDRGLVRLDGQPQEVMQAYRDEAHRRPMAA